MKIDKYKFIEYIEALRRVRNEETALDALGIDITESFALKTALATAENLLFTKEQKDTIDWWLYDCPNCIDGDDEVDVTGSKTTFEDGSSVTIANASELLDYLVRYNNLEEN